MDTTKPCDIKLRLSHRRTLGMWINKDIFTFKGHLQQKQTFEALSPSIPLVSFQWSEQPHAAQMTMHWIPTISNLKPDRLREFTKSTAENIGMDCWEVVKLVAERCLERFNAYLLEVTLWGVKLGFRHPSSAKEFMGDRRSEVTGILIELLADMEFLFLEALVDWTVSEADSTDGIHFSLPPAVELLPSELVPSGSSLSRQTSSLAQDGPTSSVTTPGSSQSGQEFNWQQIDEKNIFIRIFKKLSWMNDTIKNLSQKIDTNSEQIVQRLSTKIDSCYGSQPHPILGDESDGHSSDSHQALPNAALFDRDRSNHGESDQESTEREKSQVQVDPVHQTVGFVAHSPQPAVSSRNPLGETAPPSGKTESPHSVSKSQRQANSSGKRSTKENSVRSSQHHESKNSLRHHQSSLGSIKETEPVDSRNNRQKTPHTRPHMTSIDRPSAKPSSHHRVSPSTSSMQSTQQISSPQKQPEQPRTFNAERSSPHSQESTISANQRPDSTKSVSREKVQVLEYDGDHMEAKLVKESVDRAYLEDPHKSPKAKSFDTMLCLDISSSMKEGGAFEQMKETVLKFIDGVDENINNTGVEENMGLVVFGGRANVLQNLTNDLSLIRDKIDTLQPSGNSPFVEALLVSMAAFVKKGGIVSVSGEWEVKPRIIFFSDGRPTESTKYGVTDTDRAINISSVRLSLLKMLNSFRYSSHYNKVHPVMFVPVGQNADVSYMENMAKICDGRFVKPEDVSDLCYYFRVQETIGKVMVCLRREKGEDKLEATIQALTPDLSEKPREEVREAVKKELDNPNRNRSQHTKPNDLEFVFEDAEKVKDGERLPLGTRVIRGPDWKYENQDGGGPGTVINHHERRSIHWVDWDKTDYNCYPYSKHHGYHIWKAEDQPRRKTGDEPLEIGMTVKKGPHWKAAEAKPEHGIGTGVIIRKSREKGKVMVRWENGEMQVCNWSPDGPWEVEYCGPDEEKPDQKKPKPINQQAGASSSGEDEPVVYYGRGRWQWRDANNDWQYYSPEINLEIEAACKKKNSRSCVIERDGKQRRVMFRFKKKVEKIIDGGTECEVRRLQVG